MIRLYDTLQSAEVDLETRDEGRVGFYVCGPTVQSPPHVGHGRSAVAFDAIRRYLEWSGYEVNFVRNVTDIEDKIIEKATEAGEDVADYAVKMAEKFSEGYRGLGVRDPDVEPLATDNIAEMHDIIATLIDMGHAYQAGNDVYFAVRTDDDYGKLSGRDLDEMRAGTRVEPNAVKRDQLDFALWKGAKPGEPWWDSPWGRGRPGWHIECSAMASRYLGDDFDIHAGGTDLIFPHHENEIAQSESATGKTFARYWLHNGMVNLDGAKMAKSTGNVVDLKAALERFGGMPLRLLFLRAHYRAPIEYSEELVEEAAEAYRRIERLLERAPQTDAEPDPKVLADFSGFMNDDFATPGAVGVLFEAVRDANRLLDDGADTGPVVAAIHEILGVLGLDAAGSTSSDHEDVDVDGLVALSNELGVQPSDGPTAMVDSLLALRGEARAAKDFATSDAIRDRLAELGINVEDTADGARWIRG